jgi:urease accessory protein
MRMPTEHGLFWQLISQATPVGAFNYSQGLEHAVSAGWIRSRDDVYAWLSGLLAAQVACVDLPLIVRMRESWAAGDESAVTYWDQVSRACRETSELRSEQARMGDALRRLGRALGEAVPDAPAGFTTVFAALSHNRRVPLILTLSGFAWSWCENQVLAAVKLVPLGHLAGQRTLMDLSAEIRSAVDRAVICADEDIGMSAPGMIMASMRHETQATRLFAS